MNAFKRLAATIDRLLGYLDQAVRVALMAFTALIFTLLMLQVVMRYVMRQPLIWVEELTSDTLAFLILWGAASYVRSWQHIRVDTLFLLMPIRLRALVVIGINVLLVTVAYLLITSGHRLAMLGATDLSDSGYFNLFWPRQAMTTGGLLILLQAGNNILRVLAGNPGPLVEEKVAEASTSKGP